ncbi:O-acetylhomoserine aminocarboxypropyltransferase/cysteine synthase [Frigoribacterium sp. CFBP 13729]|uniref:O-acetylhomoserine aminocarboxypropyltransferase/cysteine synthase family protein n=1 Tax=unclassified Frigoribacterium TaxID=2627005 RepID=UPI00177F76D7|nr:O-acetylhomoserine aminocarboxypropyltransferase/cysteine synthase [Frigoribacterium sp. CFBP 8766]MBD8609240.1 O-acetylhomoserine aminocarboxypropyltransferase/cysteine synthase [Frigoribacterium sp. CFBP 13729]
MSQAHPRADHDRHGFTTEQVHGGAATDGDFGARVSPIHLSAGFVFDDFAQARDRFAGDDPGYVYTRSGNPTTAAVERRLALLEHGTDALLVGTGQAAITVALLALLEAGDHLVSASSIYEGTRGIFVDNFARLGIDVSFVDDAGDPEAWRRLIRPETKLLYGEPIPNPKNDLLDVAAIAGVAHEAGLPLVVDNTLASPYLWRPLDDGADLVVHSASKFLAGHGTALGGVVVSGDAFDWTGVDAGGAPRFPHLVEPRRALAGVSYTERFGARAALAYAREVVAARIGPAPSPFNAFLIQQGVETLSLRVERHSANALAVATWLEQQHEVESVDYAGLPSSPHHALAERYLPRGAGSVFSFTLRGGIAAAELFVDAVELVSRMTHLGDVRSLILHPGTTTHALRTPDEQRAAGIWPGLLRLSVGIEDVDDLLRDLERGLEAVRRGPTVSGQGAERPAGTAPPRLHPAAAEEDAA